MIAERRCRQRRRAARAEAIWLVLVLVLAGTAPAGAFELEPYLRVGGETGWEGNIAGRESVAAEPLASLFPRGAADVVAVALVDAGADAWLTDALGLYAGLGARGVGFARHPGFGYVTGSATLQARALELPADLDAALSYGYRDDFQGWRAQWASASLEVVAIAVGPRGLRRSRVRLGRHRRLPAEDRTRQDPASTTSRLSGDFPPGRQGPRPPHERQHPDPPSAYEAVIQPVSDRQTVS